MISSINSSNSYSNNPNFRAAIPIKAVHLCESIQNSGRGHRNLLKTVNDPEKIQEFTKELFKKSNFTETTDYTDFEAYKKQVNSIKHPVKSMLFRRFRLTKKARLSKPFFDTLGKRLRNTFRKNVSDYKDYVENFHCAEVWKETLEKAGIKAKADKQMFFFTGYDAERLNEAGRNIGWKEMERSNYKDVMIDVLKKAKHTEPLNLYGFKKSGSGLQLAGASFEKKAPEVIQQKLF